MAGSSLQVNQAHIAATSFEPRFSDSASSVFTKKKIAALGILSVSVIALPVALGATAYLLYQAKKQHKVDVQAYRNAYIAAGIPRSVEEMLDMSDKSKPAKGKRVSTTICQIPGGGRLTISIPRTIRDHLPDTPKVQKTERQPARQEIIASFLDKNPHAFVVQDSDRRVMTGAYAIELVKRYRDQFHDQMTNGKFLVRDEIKATNRLALINQWIIKQETNLTKSQAVRDNASKA